ARRSSCRAWRMRRAWRSKLRRSLCSLAACCWAYYLACLFARCLALALVRQRDDDLEVRGAALAQGAVAVGDLEAALLQQPRQGRRREAGVDVAEGGGDVQVVVLGQRHQRQAAARPQHARRLAD